MIEYHLTEQQLEILKAACRPVPYLVANGVPPPSARDRILSAWQTVAEAHGCIADTISPSPRGDEYFMGEPKP